MDNLETPDRRRIMLLAVISEAGLGVLAWLLGWLLGTPALATLRWQPYDLAVGAAATLPMLLLFAACVRWPVGPLARVRAFADEVIRPLFRPCTLADMALVALLAGVGEEMLFRGVLQGALGRWLNPGLGLAAASLLFGLLHPITPAYVVLATLLGAYLGALWLWTDSLVVVIVAHGLYDFLALVWLTRTRGRP
jgi:membrane protease YdiL (CAAX protease family)